LSPLGGAFFLSITDTGFVFNALSASLNNLSNAGLPAASFVAKRAFISASTCGSA